MKIGTYNFMYESLINIIFLKKNMNFCILSLLRFRKTGEIYRQTYSGRYIPQLVKQSLTKMCYFQLLLDGRFEISQLSSIVWRSFLNTNFTNIFSYKIMLRFIEVITGNLVPKISSLQQLSSQCACCFFSNVTVWMIETVS